MNHMKMRKEASPHETQHMSWEPLPFIKLTSDANDFFRIQRVGIRKKSPEVKHMVLRKELHLATGLVSMSVFRGEMDNHVLIALDKESMGRRIKGPLFSEEDLYDLVELIKDYDEWESKALYGKANCRLVPAPEQASQLAVEEIQSAITEVQTLIQDPEGAKQQKGAASITEIPTMPDFRYVHTCPQCGCHIQSRLLMPGGAKIYLCPACEHVHAIKD